jgi:RHS repeat-associated protein
LVGAVTAISGQAASFSKCDIDQDGTTNVADVQGIINQALGVTTPTNNLNGNGIVNVVDVQIVINAALGLGCSADSVPTITDFSPKSAPIGTLITIAGTNLQPNSGTAAQFTLAKQGGGTVAGFATTATATSITFVVPAGAASGVPSATVNGQTATAATALTIVPSSTFSVAAAPGAANLIQGQSVGVSVSLTSPSGFNALAALGVTGIPSGITAAFNPQNITTGETSILTLTAPANQPIGSSNLTITASATVQGLSVSQSAGTLLSVQAPTTSFLGRTVVSNSQETPLVGVTVSMLGLDGNGNTTGCTGSTVSDGAGNFALVNLSAMCVGPQLVGYNGSTVTSPVGQYAGVNIVYTLVLGQVTASPVLVHLPRIDNVETFYVTQNAAVNQSYSYASIPGLSVTVYAGTTFTLQDGTQPNPFPLTAVQVPVDRLPDLKPNVPTMIRAFIVAFQPANATTNEPVAVYFPNTLNTAPGTDMVLMTLDPTHGQMVPYGTGSVNSNATQIVPDPDPAHPGHLYGLVHFDWHGPMPPPPPTMNPGPPGSGPGPCSPDGAPEGEFGPGDCTTPTPPEPAPAPPPPPPPNSCPIMPVIPPPILGIRGALRAPRDRPPANDPRGPSPLMPARDNGVGGIPPEQPPAQAGDPVDLSSGIQVISNTDLAFTGSRGSIALVRNYRSLSSSPGPFGIGTGHNYSLQLNVASFVQNGDGLITLVTPDGNQFPFSLTASGTFTNTSIPAYAGAVFTNPSSGVYNLRYRNGVTYVFQTSTLGGLEAFLTAIIDSNGNAISIALNPSQPLEVTQVTDPVGRSLTFSYDSSNRITSVTDPIGRTVRYTYNSQGTLATFTDANGGVTSYAYDANNNMIQMTDPRGIIQMQNTLDSIGRVITQVRPDGGTLNFSYTVANSLAAVSPILLTQVADSKGIQATYRFNVIGFVTDVTSTQGQTKQFALQNGTNLRTGVIFSSATTTYTYDANGNVLTSTDPTELTTTLTYDPVFNKVTSITDPLGNISRFSYDVKGNLLTSTDADGNSSSYQYDSTGLLTQATDALNQTTKFTYDAFGNVISVTDPLGNTTSYAYDAISRLIQVIDALGRRTSFTYDAMGRLLTRTDATAGVTAFAYDPDGNLLSVEDAQGNTNAFTYDPMNRLLSRTDGLGRSDTRTWDTDGKLIKYVDRRGQTSTFTYDNLNRLTTETYSDATVSRSYDIYGRLNQANDSASGEFTFAYDLAGRLLGTTTPYGAVNYTYDGRGAMASRQVVGQAALSYTYDSVGNLNSASLAQASASFAYTPRNQLSTISRANGVSTTYSYDADGRLLAIAHAKGAAALASDNYGYDAIGNRMLQATSIGQALVTPATANTFNTANQLTQFGATANGFDLNGNLAQAGTATTYTWDGRNRLKSIVTSTGQTTAFTYDFVGNLLAQADRGTSLNLTKSFILDDLTNVAYETASDGTSYSVLAGRAIDSHLAVSQSNGQSLFGLTDGINSTVAAVDQTGTTQAQFLYEPYGQTTTSGTYPFRFAGLTPVNSSLYYNRARFYSSATGRFISEDALRFLPIDTNAYRYARNSPVRFRDPYGRQANAGGDFGIAIADTAPSGYAPSGYGPNWPPWHWPTWLTPVSPPNWQDQSYCTFQSGHLCMPGESENPDAPETSGPFEQMPTPTSPCPPGG